MSAPARPCPPWCTRNHQPSDPEASHVGIRQMNDGDTWVALTMAVLDGRLTIHVSNHQIGKGTEFSNSMSGL